MAPAHMNPAEALNAHLALGSRRSLAMHFAMFCLTDEGIDAPAHDLAVALTERQVATETFLVPSIGGTVVTPLA